MATLQAVGDAVCTLLNGKADWSLPFTAVRMYRPELRLEETTNLGVYVRPLNVVTERMSTGGIGRQDFSYQVVVQQRFETLEDPDSIDALVVLVGEIVDFLNAANAIGGVAITDCTPDGDASLYDEDFLYGFDTFLATIKLNLYTVE